MNTTQEIPLGSSRASLSGLPPCTHCNRAIGPGEPYFVDRDENNVVARVGHMLPLYFDECIAATRTLMSNLGFCVVPALPKGTGDTDWLREAGRNGWTAITQDGRIAKRTAERQAVIDHKVKCFVIPGRTANTWDQVRGFVSMWHKIRIESRSPGPFIWKFNDESQSVRWELLYPEALEFVAFDLSNVPIGHLLNLFADVVSQHDQGWFSFDFVNALHDNIRTEIEARILGDRSVVVPPGDHGKLLFETEKLTDGSIALEEPVNMDLFRVLSLVMSDSQGRQYPWLVPASKAAANVVSGEDGDEIPEAHGLLIRAGTVGFCRSGFGLALPGRVSGHRRR